MIWFGITIHGEMLLLIMTKMMVLLYDDNDEDVDGDVSLGNVMAKRGKISHALAPVSVTIHDYWDNIDGDDGCNVISLASRVITKLRKPNLTIFIIFEKRAQTLLSFGQSKNKNASTEF